MESFQPSNSPRPPARDPPLNRSIFLKGADRSCPAGKSSFQAPLTRRYGVRASRARRSLSRLASSGAFACSAWSPPEWEAENRFAPRQAAPAGSAHAARRWLSKSRQAGSVTPCKISRRRFSRVVFAQFSPADSPGGLTKRFSFFPERRGVFDGKGENTPRRPGKNVLGGGEQQKGD